MSFIGVAAIVLILGIFGYYGAVKNLNASHLRRSEPTVCLRWTAC